MIESLLAKILIPLVVMLVVSAIGIAVLIVEYVKESRAAADERPRQREEPPTRPVNIVPQSRAPEPAKEQDTLMVRTRGQSSSQTSQPRPIYPMGDGEATPRKRNEDLFRTRVDDTPTVPVMSPRGREGRLEPTGTNIVLNIPVSTDDYRTLPGKLEVIYGNFSPSDPREIFLFAPRDGDEIPCYTFSKTAGEGIFHVQLNHYTITPEAQAELTFVDGRHLLVNTVPTDEMDRYQTRINGIPMGVGESHTLAPGDIISMGIFRLKLSI